MAMTLPTAEDLFEETVRKVSSTPQEWLKFLNTASRVYQYTFDAQLMIYAQRPNAIGCTSFEKWKQMNHYVKRGTQGIALIVRNSENRKLRYVYDYSDTGVASNVPETDIRKPYIWSLGEDGQEDLCDYINNKYDIRPQNKDLGLVLKQLIEETVNDVIDDEISEILKEKQGSYLEDLDIDTIRKEYRELFIHSAWYMLLSRCGIEPGDYMYLEDFRAITDFNNINVISCLGTPVSEQCSFVLKDISRYLWQKNLQKNRAESIVQSNQREYNKDNKTQEQKRGVNRNDVDIHKEGGRTAVSGSGIKGSSEGIHREIRSNESRLSGAASEIKVYGDDDDRGNQSTYDRHSETGRGENGRTDARTDEDSRSNRGTEGSRSDEVGRTRKQLQTAGGGDNQRRDYIQLSLFPENPQEQAEYGTAAGNTPAAVFAFPDNYIDECLRTGGNNELSLEYVLLDLAQENPQKILAKDLKENWKGGKGLAMPDGIKVSVWYNEEGISFRRGNGARKNPERLLSWEEAAERIEILYRNGQFTTRELSENAISTIREETAGLIAFFYKEDMGQSRWGNIHSEAVISIIEELKATAGIKKLYDEISLFGTARAGSISQWQEKRCENLAERLYKLGNLSPLVPQNVQEIAPMVFITADEIDAIAVEYPQQIAKYEELTAAYEADIAHLDTAMNTPFSMEIHGITYDNEKTAGEILVQACTKMKKEHTDAADIGTFKGFKMKVSYSLFDNSFYVKLTRESSVTVEVKKDPVRNIERILTALRKMPGQKDVAEERLEGARQQLVQAKEEVNKPFEKENELRSVQERLTKINAELDMKPKEEPKKMIKKEELKKCL